MENELKLTPNQLSIIALANEYCQVLEQAASDMPNREALAMKLLRLLSRLYICMLDLEIDAVVDAPFVDNILEEASYNQLRKSLEAVFGDEDIYLEVFEEDMKYSDVPISASIAEGLCDLYQILYDVLHWMENALTSDQFELLLSLRCRFADYWGQTLVNLLRPLHALAIAGNEDFVSY